MNENIQPHPYLKLLLAALLGLMSAVITFVFMWLVGLGEEHWGQRARAIGLSAPVFWLLWLQPACYPGDQLAYPLPCEYEVRNNSSTSFTRQA